MIEFRKCHYSRQYRQTVTLLSDVDVLFLSSILELTPNEQWYRGIQSSTTISI
jgi:hypothetical protein